MSDVAEVAEAAAKYLRVIRSKLQQPAPKNLQVEEVERAADGDWLITLGYDEVDAMSLLGIDMSTRKFKVFRVSDSNGEVKSMKMRETAKS